MTDGMHETSIKNVTLIESEFENNVTIKGYKAFEFPSIHQETKSSFYGVETKFIVTFSLHRDPFGYLIIFSNLKAITLSFLS